VTETFKGGESMIRLRSKMVLHNDTIESLAHYLGISRQTLSGRMNGHTPFKSHEVMQIADRYHLGSDEIVNIFLKGDTNE